MATPQRSGGPDQSVEVGVSVDLRSLLAAAKAYSPAQARTLRRRLRSAGDSIISAQKDHLSEPLRGNAVKTGTQNLRIQPKNGRKAYMRKVNVYDAKAAARTSKGVMRGKIKASLKNRVVAGKTRSGIQIQAARSVGGPMTMVWNKRVFRRRVFGSDEWVSQFGQPYWWGPIKNGRELARAKAIEAINETLNEIARR